MVAAEATDIVSVPVVVLTVIDGPLTAATSPLTNAAFAAALGRAVGLGRGVAPGAGVAPGPAFGPTRAAQPVAAFGEICTVVTVTAPPASFWPAAKMHVPRTISASVPSEVLVNVVADV